MNSIQLKENISLSNFTTWRIGGPAEWIAQPKNNEELKYLMNWINKKCSIVVEPFFFYININIKQVMQNLTFLKDRCTDS